MKILFDEWTLMLVTTASAGIILILIVLVMEKYKNVHKTNIRFLWLLWISPKGINRFNVTVVFLIIIYEILFGIEVVSEICSLVINDTEKIIDLGSQCGIIMFIYTLIITIYVIFMLFYVKNRERTILKEFKKEIFESNTENVIVGGGGALKPMISGMMLLLILLLLVRIKQAFIMADNGNMEVIFLIPAIVYFVIIIWLILIKMGKLHTVLVNKSEIIYINWYGKSNCSRIDEIKRIEEVGAYIIFFRNEKKIFAKFNICTKGLEKLLNDTTLIQK